MTRETSGGTYRVRWGVVFLTLVTFTILPFLLFGERFESWVVDEYFNDSGSRYRLAGASAMLLAADILFPIPASFVCSYVASKSTTLFSIITIWIGLTTGHTIGFAIGRFGGVKVAERWLGSASFERASVSWRSLGVIALLLTRPIPVLAESVAILAGVLRTPFLKYVSVVATANLGIALTYTGISLFATQDNQFDSIVWGGILVPLVGYALFVVIRWLRIGTK